MKDRAMQALHLLAQLPVAETTADKGSHGFRPGRSTADAIAQCFLRLCRKDSPTWVLEGDIRGCFNHISHEWMLRHVPTDRKVLRQWLKAGFVENRILFPTEAGTPQGGIISPTLANLTLDGLEQRLKEAFPPHRLPLRWDKHRHSNKGSHWVMQKYWHHLNSRNEFAANTGQRTRDGNVIWRKLYKTTDTSIRWHPKIRGEANPFAPGWRAYFEDRAFIKKLGIHRKEAGLKTVK